MEEKEKKPGFFKRLVSGLTKTRDNIVSGIDSLFSGFSHIDDDFYEELEDLLVMSDIGAETTDKVIEKMRLMCFDRNITKGYKAKECLMEILMQYLEIGDNSLKLSTKPSVILMVGVNGVGKTTTIGKLAAMLIAEGKKVLLCAGDTFRAAAAEQLGIWAERTGADIVRHEEGSDPAAVVYDGICAGKARGADVIIIDTAGRLPLHEKSAAVIPRKECTEACFSTRRRVEKGLKRDIWIYLACRRHGISARDSYLCLQPVRHQRKVALAASASASQGLEACKRVVT